MHGAQSFEKQHRSSRHLGHFPPYPSWRHQAQNSNGDSNCKLGFSRFIARLHMYSQSTAVPTETAITSRLRVPNISTAAITLGSSDIKTSPIIPLVVRLHLMCGEEDICSCVISFPP